MDFSVMSGRNSCSYPPRRSGSIDGKPQLLRMTFILSSNM